MSKVTQVVGTRALKQGFQSGEWYLQSATVPYNPMGLEDVIKTLSVPSVNGPESTFNSEQVMCANLNQSLWPGEGKVSDLTNPNTH